MTCEDVIFVPLGSGSKENTSQLVWSPSAVQKVNLNSDER
jgi:hypothetical protein